MAHTRRRIPSPRLSFGLLSAAFFILPACSPNLEPSLTDSARSSASPKTSANIPSDLRRTYITSIQTTASAAYDAYALQGIVHLDNAAQHSTATIDRNGLFIAPKEGDWLWGLRTAEVGCVDSIRIPVADAVPETNRNRVEMHREYLDEWYLNGPLGMEQGFVLREAPPCAGFKRIHMAVDGDLTALVRAEDHLGRGQRIDFVDHESQTRLVYSDLSVVDAQGKTISAWMTVEPGGIAIEIDDAHAVYPLTIDPLVWTQQAFLYPPAGAASDHFGESVAISGNTAIIGAMWDDEVGSYAGAAYVFVRNGTTWTFEGKLLPIDSGGLAGTSVAIEGDTAVVGAARLTDNPPYPEGAVYVYTRSNGIWTFQQKLLPSPQPQSFRFGSDVAISGDTIAIGADGDYTMSPLRGRLYIFRRTNGQWNIEGEFTPSELFQGNSFANDVDIDGDTAIATSYSKASVYVYVRSGTTWTPQATFASGLFYAAALSGDTVVAGLPFDSTVAQNSGAAAVFTRTGTNWSIQATLKAQDPIADMLLGFHVALDGDVAMFGGDTTSGPSSFYVFRRVGTTWKQEQKINTLNPVTQVGYSDMAISGNTAIMGFSYGEAQGIAAGTAYIFEAFPAALGAPCSNAADCASGFCADGVCCDGACGGSDSTDCQACSIAAGGTSDGTCTPSALGVVCRNATGSCDFAESCDGNSITCPADLIAANGMACSDNDACTQTDSCQNGMCTGANPVTCAALDQCHVAGTCDAATGMCSHPNAPDGQGCDDSDLCTTMDTCAAGACVGTAITCTADECHDVGNCNASTGLCDNPAKPDGTTCGVGGTCNAGACITEPGGAGAGNLVGKGGFSCSIPGNDAPNRDEGGSFLALLGAWLVRRRRQGKVN